MNNEDIEILVINNGESIEVEIGDNCIYKGPEDIASVLRALGYSVEEVFSYLENTNNLTDDNYTDDLEDEDLFYYDDIDS